MFSRKSNPLALSLLLAGTLFFSGAQATQIQLSQQGNAFVEAMLNMMAAMGMIDRNGRYLPDETRPYGPDSAVDGWARTPWAAAERNQYASRRHWIEGRWRGANGELLEVYRGRYRLSSGYGQSITGIIRIEGRWLALLDPRSRLTRQYRYAYQDDRLALQDENGNLLLFVRAGIVIPGSR